MNKAAIENYLKIIAPWKISGDKYRSMTTIECLETAGRYFKAESGMFGVPLAVIVAVIASVTGNTIVGDIVITTVESKCNSSN